MSDMADMFRDMRSHKKALRAAYGTPCPQCCVKQPHRQPTILLPRQRCRVDGYVDPRPDLTNEQYANPGVPA